MRRIKVLATRCTRWWVAFAAASLLLTLSPNASAHKSSDAYLTLTMDAQRTTLRVDVALRDLDRDLALDSNDDGNITWGEVRSRWGDIDRLMRKSIQLHVSRTPCTARSVDNPKLDDHSDGTYAVLEYGVDCAATAGDGSVAMQYSLFQQTDADHRGLLRLQVNDGAARPMVLVPSGERQLLAMAPRATTNSGPGVAASAPGAPDGAVPAHAAPSGFTGFVAEGARHIAAGWDHILFIVTLMLVVVFRRDSKTWVVQARAKAVWVEAMKVVTAFTLTHSITLALAASGVLSPPSRWVESIIALSVLIAALDNVKPWLPLPRWTMAALFGLFHGFGFAGPLQDLGLRGAALVVPLFGFNIGVELGQLLIAAVVLPWLLLARRHAAYRQWVMPTLSIGVAVLALVWLLERALDIPLLTR